VPFRGPEGDVLGSFCVVALETRRWTDRDQQILETLSESAAAEVALRAALVAERVARLEADTAASSAEALARTLQESLLPPRLPATPGIDIAAKYRPAGAGIEVVGDFYDVFQSEGGGWNVVIGDVTGKGVEAAKVTALAHYTLRAAAMRSDTPSAVLSTLNRALLEQVSINDPRFLTALYLSCTPTASGVDITLCTAGHDPPVLKRRNGETAYVDAQGTLLGAFDTPTLTDVSLELHAGDQLLLYTDGVVDSRRERVRFGTDRLHEIVARSSARTAEELVADVDRAVMDYNDGLLPDDAALVALVAAPL
jgi:serine phosphatase RsbU (regulator of sigma subunit)